MQGYLQRHDTQECTLYPFDTPTYWQIRVYLISMASNHLDSAVLSPRNTFDSVSASSGIASPNPTLLLSINSYSEAQIVECSPSDTNSRDDSSSVEDKQLRVQVLEFFQEFEIMVEIARSLGCLQPVEDKYLELGVRLNNQLNDSKPFSQCYLKKWSTLLRSCAAFIMLLLMWFKGINYGRISLPIIILQKYILLIIQVSLLTYWTFLASNAIGKSIVSLR